MPPTSTTNPLVSFQNNAIACGLAHTITLAERGHVVFAFGSGMAGSLGTGTHDGQLTPAPVLGLEEQSDIITVETGDFFSAAVTSDGTLLLWGDNGGGQLGQGDEDIKVEPVMLGPSSLGGIPVAGVACGSYHTLVVTRVGSLFAFGSGDDGQLGFGDSEDRSVPEKVRPECLGGAIIVHAAAGHAYSGVVTSEGAVWTWGSGIKGCLGHDDEEDQVVPKQLEGQFGGARARSLFVGHFHSMVVTTSGAVWSFGCGENGLLGLGDKTNRYSPVRIDGEGAFGQSKVEMIACGVCHNLALTEDGIVWSWGDKNLSVLGQETLVPTKMEQGHFGGAKITRVSCGLMQAAAVSEGGCLFTWGFATCDGKPMGLGHDDLDQKHVPSRLAPELLRGMRIGRGLPLEPLLALAFAMGTHHRLGAGEAQVAAGSGRGRRGKSLRAAGKGSAAKREDAGSPLQALAGELGLVRMILEMCADKVQVQP